ncbi:hypothetical protein FRC07_008862 [Ceratobasidium sp. 392]|nr:hypothetical protein FRC07_008862 [Ceratobasidium sp. 392]
MSDPKDRRMANLFKIELRWKAELDPGNAWELIWFLRLPLEVQQPSQPFASLGKRQRRKPIEYGRSRTRQPRNAPPVAPPQTRAPHTVLAAHKRHTPAQRPRSKSKPVDTHTTQVNPPNPDAVPIRPRTPDSLRKSLCSNPSLSLHATGCNPDTLDPQKFSPRTVTPTEPVTYSSFPLLEPEPPYYINGMVIPWRFAYMVAAGHHHAMPWHNYTVEDAIQDIYSLQKHTPGVLGALSKVLSPSGLNNLAAAVNPSLHGVPWIHPHHLLLASTSNPYPLSPFPTAPSVPPAPSASSAPAARTTPTELLHETPPNPLEPPARPSRKRPAQKPVPSEQPAPRRVSTRLNKSSEGETPVGPIKANGKRAAESSDSGPPAKKAKRGRK